MTGLLLRIRNILFRPQQEWHAIRDEAATYQQILFGYVAVLAAVPPSAAVLERLLFGAKVAGSQPLGYVLAANLLWYLVIILNMVITAVVFTAMIISSERRWTDLRGLKLAAYSFTPLFLVSGIVIVPRLNWLIYGAILYSIYLLTLGIVTMIQSGKGKSAWLAVASCLAAGVIVGFLNGLEYMLESYIMQRFINLT